MNDDILVSGFTFIKNGISLGYPFIESIKSIDPICDEIIINVGFDDEALSENDGTFELIKQEFSHPKFKIIKSFWDPKLTEKGLVLSEQTNIALKECVGKYCLYIQGDEVIHENDLANIQDQILKMDSYPDIDGLVFNYYHFYGNVDVIKHTRNTYRREVRVIRNKIGLISHLDAQGFRFQDGKKPRCLLTQAYIYHYGWARETSVMDKKIKEMDKLYHGENYERYQSQFEYRKIWGLKKFSGTHPQCVEKWVSKHRNSIDVLSLPLKYTLKDLNLALADFIERLSGWRIGEYKGYKIIKV